ncbi:MAG: hypothetical protein AAGJ35_12965 [Myxococcota bacterium]
MATKNKKAWSYDDQTSWTEEQETWREKQSSGDSSEQSPSSPGSTRAQNATSTSGPSGSSELPPAAATSEVLPEGLDISSLKLS